MAKNVMVRLLLRIGATKVIAACNFVSKTGKRAALGVLGDLDEIINGTRRTNVSPEGGEVSFRDVLHNTEKA